MSTDTPVLKARGLVKRYGRVVALDNADFDLMPGEILAVIGDNGAGKSTLIKALCGAVQPDGGTIELAGKAVNFRSPIEARHAGIETVYQNLALSPALSIADNMFLGREMRKPGLFGQVFRRLDRAQMARIAREKLSELGLMTIQNINQSVEALSGGQRQGVAVARAADCLARSRHASRSAATGGAALNREATSSRVTGSAIRSKSGPTRSGWCSARLGRNQRQALSPGRVRSSSSSPSSGFSSARSPANLATKNGSIHGSPCGSTSWSPCAQSLGGRARAHSSTASAIARCGS